MNEDPVLPSSFFRSKTDVDPSPDRGGGGGGGRLCEILVKWGVGVNPCGYGNSLKIK